MLAVFSDASFILVQVMHGHLILVAQTTKKNSIGLLSIITFFFFPQISECL